MRRPLPVLLVLLCAGAVGGVLTYAVDRLVLGGDGFTALLVGGACAWGAGAGALVMALRARREAAAGGRVEVATRLVTGRQDGVGPRWRAGTVESAPGGLLLTPLLGGLRFLPGTPVVLPVDAVQISTERTAGRDAWRVTAGMPVLEVRTPSAVLQLAVPAGSEQHLVRLVQKAD